MSKRRRRSPGRGKPTKAASEIDGSRRRAARERARSIRQADAEAQRADRARERMRRELEREEAVAAAKDEHDENERYEFALKTVLSLAPQPIRDRPSWTAEAKERPFPRQERLAKYRKVIEEEVLKAGSSVRPPLGLRIMGWSWTAAVTLFFIGLAIFLHGYTRVAALVASVASLLTGMKLTKIKCAGAIRERRQSAENLARERAERRVDDLISREMKIHEAEEARRTERLRRLLDGDPDMESPAVQEALDGMGLPIHIGASAVFDPLGPTTGEVHINLPEPDVVPAQRSTLLKSGRVSYRNKPRREVQETYARLVASLALLYAAKALDAAPAVDVLLVSGFRPWVDPGTGQEVEACFVSLIVDREEMEGLRLDRVDALVTVERFEHRFDPGPGHVLRPVEPFRPLDLTADDAAGPAEEDASLPPTEKAPLPAPPAGAPAARASFSGETRPAMDTQDEPDLIADTIRLAMACARADGRLEPREIQAVASLWQSIGPLSRAAKKRLEVLQSGLETEGIDIERATRRLRQRMEPRARALLVERLFEVAASDHDLSPAELTLISTVALNLDLPDALLAEFRRRYEAHLPSSDARRRSRWLAALELPDDSDITRALLERSYRRVMDDYGEHRFAGLTPDILEVARKRRELAEEAYQGLSAGLPEDAPGPAAEPDTTVRRDNRELDSIFE